MFSPSRRLFLGTSLAGLGAACLFAKDDLAKSLPKLSDDPPFRPDTLFLTWQRDPTTTMTVQWVGALGETTDTTVYYVSLRNLRWGSQPAVVRPYPHPLQITHLCRLPVIESRLDGSAQNRYRFQRRGTPW